MHGQALRVSGSSGCPIWIQSAHEVGNVDSPTYQAPLPPAPPHHTEYRWYSYLLGAESTPGATVRPVGLCQLKILKTRPRIEPATFRLVAQCLNQLRHRLPAHKFQTKNSDQQEAHPPVDTAPLLTRHTDVRTSSTIDL